MPLLTQSSYSLHHYLTGSILCLGLVGGPGVAYGFEQSSEVDFAGEDDPAIALESAALERGLELEPLAAPLPPAEPPLLAQSVLTYAPEVANPAIPAITSFSPAATTAAPGAQVPWPLAQGLPMPEPVVAPAIGSPGPGAYYPAAVPYPGGMWVMVWMPYGMPVAAPGTSPLPPGAVPTWPQPAPGMYGVMPALSSPGMAPQGYPIAGGAVPWGTASVPYGYAPPGYGAAQAFPALPAYQGVAQPFPTALPPYAQGNPAMTAPLAAVPPLQSAAPTAQWPAPLPAGPVGTYLPPETPSLGALVGQNSAVEGLPPAPAIAGQSVPEPNLNVQGLYVLQGDRSSARARLSGDMFLTPNLLVGGALDLTTGPDLTSRDGVQLTELYLTTALAGAPGLRFRLGQLDLTSYFDRNSFAKDISRDFFNPVFQTNPALIGGVNNTASHPGGLVQWAVTDDITLNAAVFSSAGDITDFALDGFAGEVGFRTGDLIVRGTFATTRDTAFQGTGGRLDAYGVNAEWFIPQANLGFFGRYGRLNNSGSGFSGDTYSLGLNVVDVFMDNDRLGLGYGRNLATAVAPGQSPDALELFYDFELMPNLRLGFTFQQRDQFRESYAGFRIRSDWNLLPGRSLE
ncbi:carbohydrate porin [Nodosilinea sp. E11]|uniref:carbohydrate porin n=1 Tax=Nodosilinea sp. E11 TaxID=3037479 RepID=UPI0029344B01|nr:carbohydrate porin [Nodosilinea sp. E11]WOD38619.1 hypothetical protein RRF56_20630 [Nodosilinea sp. E11]